ncbi:MAG: hypothetical protein R6X02_26850 [Enhygromyxa sp.]
MPRLLERLFGPPRPLARDYRRGPKLAGLDPVSERAVALQKRYWSPNPDELAALEARAFESLDPRELLRLHHLRCLALLDARDAILRRALLAPKAERPAPAQLQAAVDPKLPARVERSAAALLARRSRCRPRHGFVWLGAGPPAGDEVPYSDLQGRLVNASLTHLGCLEVIALDDALEPARVEFLDFDQILTISIGAGELGPAAPFRPARILREYGRAERVVLLPLRYGFSWFAHEPELLRGTAEHEVASLELRGLADPSRPVGKRLDRRPLGVAVGPQRFEIASDYPEEGEAGLSRFRLADAYQISLAIDQDDPRFADKCRGRGIDPEATRGDVVRESRLRASARAKRQGAQG